MAYKEEYKQEILEQMKTKKIDEIAKETGISKATLYNWKNEKYREEINKRKITQKIFEPIKANMRRKKEDDIEKQERLAEANPQNKYIQMQLMRMYVKKGREEEAIEFAGANPQNKNIQTQLMRMYVEKGREEEAIKFAEANPQNKNIQTQLMKMYVEKGREKEAIKFAEANSQNGQIQTQLMKMYVEREKEYFKKAEILAKINSQNEQIQEQLSDLYKIGKRQTVQLTKPNTENEKTQQDSNEEQEVIGDSSRQDENANVLTEELSQENEVIQEEINEEQEVIGDSSRQDENANVLTEELSQEEKKKEQVVVGKYVTSEHITGNSSKPKKKTNNNAKKSKSAKTSKRNTIESNLNKALKETISKINCYYYVHMQPQSNNERDPKEYQDLTRQIVAARKDKRKFKQLQELMEKMLKNDYEEASRQEKYIKKYDKLQSILECDNGNKRAQMELMLVLINEGYREVAKREFPEADYEFIDKIIKGYYAKTIKPEVAKKEIDEYCI